MAALHIFVGGAVLLSLVFSEPIFSRDVGPVGKSQVEISKVLSSLPKQQHLGVVSYLKKHSLVSTVMSNIKKPNINSLKKLGFKEYIITNKEGSRTRVLMKMHQDEKRPTVAFIAGTGLSIDMEAYEEFALPLAHHLNWNIVLIENHTAGEWIRRNRLQKRIILSGYEAGWDTYLTLKAIRELPEAKPFILDLHLVGLSLGGSDAAFTSYFDSKLKTDIIDGAVMAWSSPADRFMGLHRFRQMNGLSGYFVNFLLRDIYAKGEEVFKFYSNRDHEWFLTEKDTKTVLREMYLASAQNYFEAYDHHFDPAYRKVHFDDPITHGLSLEQYLSLFSLHPYIDKIDKPLMWVHSKDDPLVAYSMTKNIVSTYQQNQCIGFLAMKSGGHLGYSTAYGSEWLLSTIVRYLTYWGKHHPQTYLRWAKESSKQRFAFYSG